MPAGRTNSGAGRILLLILSGGAIGTLIGYGFEKISFLAPFLRPAVIDFPSHTYLDFFFITFSFGFRLNITVATVLGAMVGYYLARKW